MCNTRSNVYLQSMKTYTLSVNTLMRNLTSEHHDNCASYLGLILPIRWVTPPPNFCSECFLLALNLLSLLIWFIFNIDLSLCWSSLCWFSLTQIYTYICVLSSTAFTYSYVFLFDFFWTKWMWSDPNLFYASSLNSIYPNHMHSIETVECLLCVLVNRRQRDKH